jgi:potassium-transporting ATPase KdpC subunit
MSTPPPAAAVLVESKAPTGASSPPPSVPVAPPPAHSTAGHVRATVVFLILMILLSGIAYPFFVTGIAQVIDPSAAHGSLLKYPNGTVAGSSLVAQNTSAPYLFWSRPSLTDYITTLGADTPPGPTDPALGALLNETIAYMEKYGTDTVNATLPFWLVSESASSIDPDLTPAAVLVQVPRVANATNLSIGFLLNFVNDHITNPPLADLGVPYVDVLQLDLALLPIIGR